MNVNSRDFVIQTAIKEVLDNLKYVEDQPHPWDDENVIENKRIVREYLEFTYKNISDRIMTIVR